jgi:large subunit ribosomal protein L5
MAATTKYIPRMKAHYLNTVRADLMKQLDLQNPMQVPSIEKIVINMGVGRATQQASLLDGAVADLTAITGQKPLVTKSRIAIASFKLRENQAIGCKVTMRGDRMWEFFDRLLSIAIPRIRDFRGLSGKSWDGNGNYTFGLTEQLAFMEVRIEQVDVPRGMDITIVTTAKSDIEGKALLDAFGFPFRKGEVPASVTKAKKSKKK